ncbi:ribonuclease HII [Bacteroidota bacterium]
MKNFDKKFLSDNIGLIAGIDEAGRGPLAGPVVAAAVIFENDTFIPGINDSKKLSEKKREILFDEIIDKAAAVGIGIVDHKTIDSINILQAALRAMSNAVSSLKIKPDLILIDGNKKFHTEIPAQTVVKGDQKSFSIAAASIVAKVTRDKIMIKHSPNFPQYLWHKNKGYATKAHIAAIKEFGYTHLHRKSFLSKILNIPKEELLFDLNN